MVLSKSFLENLGDSNFLDLTTIVLLLLRFSEEMKNGPVTDYLTLLLHLYDYKMEPKLLRVDLFDFIYFLFVVLRELLVLSWSF